VKQIITALLAGVWFAVAAVSVADGAVVVDIAISATPFQMANTVARGYDAASQSFTIVNSQPDNTMYYQITYDEPWLKADPAVGVVTGNVITGWVSYSAAALNIGTSNAIITIIGTNALESLVTTNTIAVSLVVQAFAGLGCNGTDLQAEIRQGQTPASTTFGVWNASAGGQMSWTAVSDASWLSVDPGLGTCLTEMDTITVQYATAGLGMGQYTGHITVHGVDALTGLEAVQSPRVLAVSLTILGTKDLDFMGDGEVSDLAVYQESSGNWCILRLSDRSQLAEWMGGPGYMPAPGDYDGDGQTELGVYRPESGAWYARPVASDWITTIGTWGSQGYQPVPGDYDGDGRTDFMVYQESAGLWYLQRSSDGVVVSGQFGGPGYNAQPGDYDGDRTSDAAVYDEGSGNWYIITVNGVVIAWNMLWGGADYTPVAGDYNGDGRTDLGAYHEGTGLWFMSDAAGNVIGWWISWGAPGYQPVAKDFNGDEAAEMAVYQASTGLWYIRTVGGTILENGLFWGGPGYTPVP